MLSEVTIRLLEEVIGMIDERKVKAFGSHVERRKQRVREDPEACLVVMLELIKKNLPRTSAPLSSSIEGATYDGYLKEAREKLTAEG